MAETPATDATPAPAKKTTAKRTAKKAAATASTGGSGKLTLSMHWLDEEGWAGSKGKQYVPGDKVSLENAAHAQALRQAGYEAREGQ